MKTLFYLVLAAFAFGLFTTSCGDTQPVDPNATADSTATTTVTTTTSIQETPDFNKFFDIFKNNVVNKDYSAIDFPFHSGGVEKKTVAEADIKDHYLYIFEDMKALADLKIAPYANGELDAYLEENLTKKYGDLNNMYVVEGSNGPESFYAYFRLVDGNYKMIGLHYVPGGM